VPASVAIVKLTSVQPTCLHESPLPLDHGHQPPSTAVNPGPGSQLAEGLMKVVWLELRHKSLGATLLRAFPSKSAADDKFWPLGKLEKGPFIPVASRTCSFSPQIWPAFTRVSVWAERIHASLQSRWQRPCLFLCDGLGSLDWTDISKDPDALVAAAVQLAIIFELRWAAVRSEAHSEKESHDFSLFACVGDFGPGSRHLLQQNHILALPNPDPAFKVANANTIAAEVLQLSPSDLRPYLHASQSATCPLSNRFLDRTGRPLPSQVRVRSSSIAAPPAAPRSAVLSSAFCKCCERAVQPACVGWR
jgi:hypothetical protein